VTVARALSMKGSWPPLAAAGKSAEAQLAAGGLGRQAPGAEYVHRNIQRAITSRKTIARN